MSIRVELPEGDWIELPGDRLRVGRGTSCELRLPDDPTVDLEHCLLTVSSEGCELLDLHSVTHSYLNGEAVERARVAVGDRIGIGASELLLLRHQGDRAELVLRPLSAVETVASTALPARPPVDYAAAYALSRRGLLNKTGISLLTLALALAGCLMLAARVGAGKSTAPRPGPVSPAHSARDLGARCDACHAPFRGAVDQRCEACHQGPEHQARQAASPACGSCHSEHRRLPLLARVTDASCTHCHANLEIKGGGEPRVARTITSFEAHPEFRPPADNTPLAFHHALHLKPNLPVAGGRVTLQCADCHTFEAESGEILAVSYEQHCQRCHDLVFDPALPAAPHGDPEMVAQAIVGAYLRDPSAAKSLSGEGLRSLIFGGRRGGLSFDEATRRRALSAADQVFRNQCRHCHRVELPNPLAAKVEPVVIPERWLDGARFSHGPHRQVACTECHTSAATSRLTSDVLVPAMASCLPCHGAGKETPTSCVTCHLYHEKSGRGWEAASPAGGASPSPANAANTAP